MSAEHSIQPDVLAVTILAKQGSRQPKRRLIERWTDRRGHAECPALANARTRPSRPTLASAISRRTQRIFGLKILGMEFESFENRKDGKDLSSEERKVAVVEVWAGARKFSPTSASTLRSDTSGLANSANERQPRRSSRRSTDPLSRARHTCYSRAPSMARRGKDFLRTMSGLFKDLHHLTRLLGK